MSAPAKVDLRNHLAHARDEWLAGSEGLSCGEGTATGVHLRNRLERAFIAGYDSGSTADARGVSDAMVEAALSAYREHMDDDCCCVHAIHMRQALEAALLARDGGHDPFAQVIAAVRAYLPPDGITRDELVTRIIGIVDPGE